MKSRKVKPASDRQWHNYAHPSQAFKGCSYCAAERIASAVERDLNRQKQKRMTSADARKLIKSLIKGE